MSGSWLKIGASKVLFSTDNHKHLIYVNELTPCLNILDPVRPFSKQSFDWIFCSWSLWAARQTDNRQQSWVTLCIQIEIQLMDFPWIVHHRITKNCLATSYLDFLNSKTNWYEFSWYPFTVPSNYEWLARK